MQLSCLEFIEPPSVTRPDALPLSLSSVLLDFKEVLSSSQELRHPSKQVPSSPLSLLRSSQSEL